MVRPEQGSYKPVRVPQRVATHVAVSELYLGFQNGFM